jgi:hypothetical protein
MTTDPSTVDPGLTCEAHAKNAFPAAQEMAPCCRTDQKRLGAAHNPDDVGTGEKSFQGRDGIASTADAGRRLSVLVALGAGETAGTPLDPSAHR